MAAVVFHALSLAYAIVFASQEQEASEKDLLLSFMSLRLKRA